MRSRQKSGMPSVEPRVFRRNSCPGYAVIPTPSAPQRCRSPAVFWLPRRSPEYLRPASTRSGGNLRHQGCSYSFRFFLIRRSRALPGNDFAYRSASVDPDRARTVHEESAILTGDADLIDEAFRGVPLVQHEALRRLRHALLCQYSYSSGTCWSRLLIIIEMAGRQGFEPRYADPESAVLPLDDLPNGTRILALLGPAVQGRTSSRPAA
jgi:hypothetical protein